MFRVCAGRRRRGLAVRFPSFAVLLAALALTPAAPASDVHDLQRNLPLEVEDTTTSERGSVEAQASARYERTNEGEDQLTIEPQLQYGVLPNLQIELSYPVLAGDAERGGSGNLTVGALYNFLPEENARPALAVSGQAELPTGVDADGVDTDLRLL